MSMIVPLGLDLTNFEKELKRAGALLDKFGKEVDNAKNLKPTKQNADGDLVPATRYKKAREEVNKLEGTMQKIKDTQKAIVAYAESFNLKTASGQKSLAVSYNNWSKIQKSIGDSSISFEKLYKMQQEYQKLTGTKYNISNTRAGFSQIQGLDAALQNARLAYMPKTIDESNAKIKALQNAQNSLNITTSDGRSKFAAYQKEIDKTEKSIEELTGRKKQLTGIARELQNKLLAVFGINTISNFTKNVIQIGGEFEKQKVALSSIVGDISRANVLFSQLKAQALESPFRFKELIDGTRQLAAYNIEAEKLYDTQFMLTELSAGLGVEMSRLVLAFGQVKAASVLRGQELRQFTEAGIPMVQALADKFTALEGRVVSTGEVFDRISNRMVSFQMVNDVLREMTEQGGKFYKMQEKQAETLYGQMNNMSDAIDIMYMDIAQGNSSLLMGGIKLAKTLVENWKDIELAVKAVSVLFIGYAGYNLIMLPKIIAETAKYQQILMSAAKAQALLKTVTLGFFAAIAVGAVIAISHLYNISQEMNRFEKQMSEIRKRNADDIGNESRELDNLINKMAELSVGSNEYIKIKEKISTQFGQYFPRIIQETDGVNELRGMYDSAKIAMSAYYSEKARFEGEEAIKADKGISRRRKDIVSSGGLALQTTLSGSVVNKETSRDIMEEFERSITNDIMTIGTLSKGIDEMLIDAANKYGLTMSNVQAKIVLATDNFAENYIEDLTKKTQVMYKEMDKTSGAFSDRARDIKKFLSDELEKDRQSLDKDNQLSLKLGLDYDLEKERLNLKETASKYAVMAVQELEEALAKEGKGRLGKATSQQFASALINQQPFNAGDNTFATVFKKYEEQIKSVYSSGSPVQKITKEYFRQLNESLKKEEAQLNKNNKAAVDSFNAKNKAATAVRNLASGLQSLEDAYAMIETRDATQKSMLRLQAQLLSGYLSPETKTAIQQQFLQEKSKYDTLNELIKAIGIDLSLANTKPKKPENDEPSRVSRLVSLYKELFNSYKQYAEYKDDEYAKQQSLNEVLAEYNELNKEMGGKLGGLENITSQAQLVERLSQLEAKGIFKTKQGRTALQKATISELGGQTLKAAKDEFDKIKIESDLLISKLSSDTINKSAVDAITGIIQKLKEKRFGDIGKELAIDLQKKLDENALTVRVSELDIRQSKAQSKYGMTAEFEQIKKETGIDLASLYPDMVMSFNEYADEMSSIRRGFLESDINEIKKANNVEQAVRKATFDEFVKMVKETATLTEKYGDKSQKLKILQDAGNAIKNELISAEEEMTNTVDEQERKRLQIRIDYLKMKQKANADEVLITESDIFRLSKLYDDLYGDISNMSEGARKRQLKALRDVLKPVANAKGGSVDIVSYSYLNDDGVLVTEKIKMNSKEANKAFKDINKELGKMRDNAPANQLFRNMKDAFKGGEDSFDSLGAGMQNIGQIGQELTPLLDVFHADQYTRDMTEGIIGGVSALGRIAANPADIGAYVELVTSWVKVFDADNSKRIVEHAKAIESLSKAYDEIGESLDSVIGLEGYQDRLNTMMENINMQISHYQQMISEERAKKATDKAAIEDYQNKIEEAQKKQRDFVKSTIAEMGTTIESAASQFASAWESALLETGNGMSAFEQSFDEMMKGIVRKQIQMKYVEKALAPTIAAIERAVDPFGAGGIGITKEEIDNILANKGISKNALGALNKAMEDLYSSIGLTYGGGVFDTLSKGIQGITENSAQVIASYLNSIRLEVHLIRMAVESRSGGVYSSPAASIDYGRDIVNIMNEYYPQYLTNLIAIRDNTNYLRDAYNPTTRGFRVS